MSMKPINPTAHAILSLIHGYLTKKKRTWSLISQSWMLEKLEEWYGIRISRACLSYNLALLRQYGLLESIKRHQRGPTGALECRVTLYKLTKAMRKYFYKAASYFYNIGWRRLKKRIISPKQQTEQRPYNPELDDPVHPIDIRSFIESFDDPDTPPSLSFA